MFRESYYSTLSGIELRHGLVDNISDKAHMEGYIGHIGHCFDYVRQSILCAGDMTIEKALTHPQNGDVIGVHQCKDWEKAVEWD